MTSLPDDLGILMEPVLMMARRAADAIMMYYQTGAAIESKADGTPVTAADLASEAIILRDLKALTPDIPIISEERVAAGDPPQTKHGVFWLVDPLDGTRGFIADGDDFAINIALVQNNHPCFGLIMEPVSGLASIGWNGREAWRIAANDSRQRLRVRQTDPENCTVLMSRHGADAGMIRDILPSFTINHFIKMNGAGKYALLAAGKADFLVRLHPTSEWDTAAGQALVEAAGGSLNTVDDGDMIYGKQGLLNPGFIARAHCPECPGF